MGKISLITNGAQNLVDFIKKSPSSKSNKSLEIVKKDGVISSVTRKPDTRTVSNRTSRDLSVPDLNSVAKPNTSNGTSLLSHIARKNNLMQEANDLTRQLISRKDIENEIATTAIQINYDVGTAIAIAIDSLSNNLKIISEFSQDKGIDDVKKNLSITEKNKALIESLEYDKRGDGSTNTDGKTIIPRKARAFNNSEKAIETSNMNNMKIDSSLIDGMFDKDDINPFASLVDEAQEFLKNMNGSIYDKDNQGGLNG